MAAKRRQLKAKEIEMEEKWMALEEAERRNMQKEREINEKLASLRRQDEEEVVARMESLKALEVQLNEKNRELKMKKEERDREINNKLEAIRVAEEERLKKEKEIEEKAIDFAQKEQYINKRLALIEEASVARRRKERQVEERVFDFTQKEKEISNRLAAIEEASVARRRKEKEVEDKIMLLAQRERKIDEKLGSIETASVISRQKRHMEEREREMEMEEKLRLIELNKKEQLIREKNNALEEAMELNIQRENEIKERMNALDAATNALLQKANAAQVARDDSNDNTDSTNSLIETKEEEDWYPKTDDLKQNIENQPSENQPFSFFSISNNIAKAFDFPSTDSIAKAFDTFTCSGSVSADGYMPKNVEVSAGNMSVGSEMSTSDSQNRWNKYPVSNRQETHLPTVQSVSQENSPVSSAGSTATENSLISDQENFREQHTSGSKQINDSLSQALKASMQLYVPADERENQRPLKPSLKMASASPHRNNTSKKESKNGNKKGGLKNKLKSVLGRNKPPKQRSKKVTVCHEL
eukprot:scaffold7496_cov87-Skeletonema_marinoi.AAC.2